MKNMKIFAAVVIAALALSSCTTYSYTTRSTAIQRQDLQGTAMVVDVRPDFSKRIVTESKRCKTPQEAREEARYLAVTENKCDVIVDPVYKVEKRIGKYKAYLTGFAGFYQNARTFIEDIQLLQNISREDIDKYLLLKDPSILGLMNPSSHSDVINIFEGKAPNGEHHCCKAEKPAPAPAQAPEPAPKKKK